MNGLQKVGNSLYIRLMEEVAVWSTEGEVDKSAGINLTVYSDTFKDTDKEEYHIDRLVIEVDQNNRTKQVKLSVSDSHLVLNSELVSGNDISVGTLHMEDFEVFLDIASTDIQRYNIDYKEEQYYESEQTSVKEVGEIAHEQLDDIIQDLVDLRFSTHN